MSRARWNPADEPLEAPSAAELAADQAEIDRERKRNCAWAQDMVDELYRDAVADLGEPGPDNTDHPF